MKKVLVVDDNFAILEVIEYFLTSNGFNVQTHPSGLMVNEVVNHYKPDLVLLDILLPGKMGTQVCNEIKELHDIPVILFSAHANVLGSLCISNADAFIKKPFDIQELVTTIKSYID